MVVRSIFILRTKCYTAAPSPNTLLFGAIVAAITIFTPGMFGVGIDRMASANHFGSRRRLRPETGCRQMILNDDIGVCGSK